MSKQKNDTISLDLFLKNKLSTTNKKMKRQVLYFDRLGGNIVIKQIDEFTLEENQLFKTEDVEDVKKANSIILRDSLEYPDVKNKEFQASLGVEDAIGAIMEIFTTFEIGELAQTILNFSEIQGNFKVVDKGLGN